MTFILFLLFVTILILFLSYKIWVRTREIGYVFGIALIFYWSLLGPWFFVIDVLNNNAGKDYGLHYYYLFEKMFPVYLNNYYLLTILCYSSFIVLIQLFILKLADKVTLNPLEGKRVSIKISHYRLFIVSIIAVLLSTLIIWKEIIYSFRFNDSIYTVTRTHINRFFTFHQLLNIVAIAPLFVGFLTYLSHKEKFLSGDKGFKIGVLYFVVIFVVEGYLTAIGNKRELLFAGILGILFYYKNNYNNFRVKNLVIFVFIFLIPLIFNDTLRNFSPTEIINGLFKDTQVVLENGQNLPEEHIMTVSAFANSTVSSFLFSNEMFCAHFSMYGVLLYVVPINFGVSFLNLFASLVPRFLVSNRPMDVYSYYAESVYASKGQGYTIHHATAWYLNFGILGILIGAFVLTYFWTKSNNRSNNLEAISEKKIFVKLFYIIAPIAIVAHMPSIIRGGPEVYKSLLFEAILLTVIVLYICVIDFKSIMKKIGARNK